MKKLIFSMLFVGIIFGSCSKEENNANNGKHHNSDALFSQVSTSEVETYLGTLNLSDLNYMADMHNPLVYDAFENFNFQAEDKSEELQAALFATNFYQQFEIHLQNMDLTSQNHEVIVNENLSAEALLIIEVANDILEQASTFSELSTNLTNLEEQIEIEMSSLLDKYSLLMYTKVMKNSAEYWFSVDKGGIGHGDDVLKDLHGAAPGPDRGTRVVVADALGAAGAFIGGAFVTAATGGTGVAIFYSVGWASAWSSSMAALI